jgi:hypothetical protein
MYRSVPDATGRVAEAARVAAAIDNPFPVKMSAR